MYVLNSLTTNILFALFKHYDTKLLTHLFALTFLYSLLNTADDPSNFLAVNFKLLLLIALDE